MAMPEEEVEAPTRNRQVTTAMKTVPEWFVPFVRSMFGERNAKFWSSCVEKGKVSPHPVWELAPDRVVNRRLMLLGDAAHMASPRTGAGAYTAMQDAVMMGEALQQGATLEAALRIYNDDTIQRSNALHRSSQRAASYFAPPNVHVVSPSKIFSSSASPTAGTKTLGSGFATIRASLFSACRTAT